ncbi:MAG TPA: sugar phosphate isomerase/epimerase family protein [Verrucomicrobiae bacterium]|nr:sugar phosphate isomerase/epimerase family protein [Verrucomicrobiae bacterium]
MKHLLNRLAVCSWSLQPAGPRELIDGLKTIGLARAQIALGPLRSQPEIWGNLPALCRQNGIELVTGMFGTVGEDYSTLESIRRTGGVVPDATWNENWRNIQADADLAQRLGLKVVSFHAGFLPHDPTDPDFKKLLDRIGQIADLFAARRIDLAFETGQETAATLKAFLQQLRRPNVGVNFDPANMILYDKGDPIEALRALGPWLKQCHIKDATRTKTPGAWGEEVVVGTGEVNWPAFFQALGALRFNSWLAIEREAGNKRVEDIRAARRQVEAILNRG